MSILQKGQVLPWERGEIRIEAVLGAGMTAEVYKALAPLQPGGLQEVALKYLRPGATRDVENLFFAEPENLQRVYQAWESAQDDEGLLGQLVRAFPFPAPRLWGESREPPFILMDLIRGTPLDEFLAAYREEHDIEDWEPLVLTLGVHLGTLLWVLHEYARRCYSDMKIGNFWWAGSEEAPALLLTDWNVLNDMGTEWVQRDLFLATLMLYTWLTGDVLPRQRLQIAVPLGTLPAFRGLSRGVRQFLRRALSPTLNIRYASAEAWTKALWEVLGWWRMDDDALMQSLEKEVAAIRELEAQIKTQESEGTPERQLILAQAEAYQKFGNMLDIAGLRGLASEEYEAVYQDYIDRLSPLGIGQRALQGLSFDLAMEQFERGASLFPDQAPSYRHWWTAADGAKHIPMEVFRRIRDKVLQAVEKANGGRWREAKSLLDEAAATILGKEVEAWQTLLHRLAEGRRESGVDESVWENGIVVLAVEAQAVLLEQEARRALQRGDYERAESLASQARALTDLLPLDDHHLWYIQSNEIAALEDEVARRKESSTKESELWGVIRQAWQEGEWAQAMDALRNAWDWLPEKQRGEVLKAWLETGRQMWERGDVQALSTLVGRLASLTYEGWGENAALKAQFVMLQNVLALLHQLASQRMTNFESVDWGNIETWWQDLLERGRQLQWGLQPLLQEATAWAQATLESGTWEGWYRLVRVWETVDWDVWNTEVVRLRQRAHTYLRNLLERRLSALETLSLVLTERTPLLTDLAESDARALALSLSMARDVETSDLQSRLQKVEKRVQEVKAAQSRIQEAARQHRGSTWRTVEQALSLGRPFPGEQPLGALVDALGALRAMGEREIPEEYPNTMTYYRVFVAQNPRAQGDTPLARLHHWIFQLWLASTDREQWQEWLTLLKRRGVDTVQSWESVYWWASQLSRHLPAEDEETRMALQQVQEEALDTLDFLRYLGERLAHKDQPVAV